MRTELIIGGTINNVGEENFSTTARHIFATFRAAFPSAKPADDTYIGIYEDGEVWETVRMEAPFLSHLYVFDVVDGRIYGTTMRDSQGEWIRLRLDFINIVADVAAGRPTDIRAEDSWDRWAESLIDQQATDESALANWEG
jgi:hypothetical protein